MNWKDFKIKYKQEIRVGVIVFVATMLMKIIKYLLNKN
jgi:hypothetical protein